MDYSLTATHLIEHKDRKRTVMFVTAGGSWQRAVNGYVTVSADLSDIFYTSGNIDNLCGYHDGVLNQYYTLITCNSAITGRFVQIQFYTTDYLNLYEVEVHGM